MPIITFYTDCKEETGNTVSAMVLATYLGIAQNKRTLLVSTAYNDKTFKDGLWPAPKRRISGLFGPNTNTVIQSGIEDLDRMVKSNRITPQIIPNYARIALKGRFEVLTSYMGIKDQYNEMQNHFSQIITLASQIYNNVIVDLDKDSDEQVKQDILSKSDVIVALTNQNVDNISNLTQKFGDKKNVIIALGKYDGNSRYNSRNITRSILKQKNIVNTIPYNTLIFEAAQEGKIIDVCWNFLNLKNKDQNYEFIQEIKRLGDNIENTYLETQMRK